jgi:hypothetical protein
MGEHTNNIIIKGMMCRMLRAASISAGLRWPICDDLWWWWFDSLMWRGLGDDAHFIA